MLDMLWFGLVHAARSDEIHRRKLYFPTLFLVVSLVALFLGVDKLFGCNESWYLMTAGASIFSVLWLAIAVYIVLRDTKFRNRFATERRGTGKRIE
jgi:hypothetical protein